MPRDLSTAILDTRIKNQLRVLDERVIGHSKTLEPYEICIHPDTQLKLDLYTNGPCLVKGKVKRENILCVVSDSSVPVDTAVLSSVTRKNLKVRVNDSVKLYKKEHSDIDFIEELCFYPVEDTVSKISGNLFDSFIVPFFSRNITYVSLGNVYKIKSGLMSSVEFKVVKIIKNGEEIQHGYVYTSKDDDKENSLVDIDGSVTREEIESEFNQVGYDDIGGVRRQLAQIREAIELPMKHPDLFKTIGVKPPKGILLHGPPGTGKTLIARAIANECGATFFVINGPEIMSKMSGESESNLRKIFQEAENASPSIIFMDEIDSIAPKRDKSHDGNDKKIVSQLLTLMDGMKSSSNIIFLAATNLPNSIDPALRRFGRLDREIEIGVPDDVGRLEIFGIHTKNMHLDEKVDLAQISKETHGLTGSDIASLCSEAALQQIREKLPYIDLDSDKIDAQILASLKVTNENFRYAINNTDPSSLREFVIESPNVKWEDIGGLRKVKDELRETVQYPIDYPEKYLKFNTKPSRGVLLYGPPGCGKTLLAKAIATQCEANFICIKGPEILNMYVGESEANVRHAFEKARGSAPCVLFLDEIDSIGMKRGGKMGGSGVNDSVLNQILVEMDGMTGRKDVFVLGATNKPEILDTALCRPGRLDQLVYIPPPDKDSRRQIFQAILKKSPLDPSLDLTRIADHLKGFSGADISEICQRSCKHAIKESIEHELKNGPSEQDPVPYLKKKHFDLALQTARRSITQAEIDQYEAFARSMHVEFPKYDDDDAGNDSGIEDDEAGLFE